MKRLALAASLAGLLLGAFAGCPNNPPAPAPKPDTTASIGAVCDTALSPDSTTAAADTPASPLTEKPKPAPKPEPSKELPKMWDFGSENCIPCKEMLRILTPMMAEYQGKVDIRIINVYEDKARTQQFRIVTIPTQVFISPDGAELYRHIGVYPADSITAKFREFGWE